ncbi:MAG: phosphotransferase [Paracoccaceae bacterium]|nr:phosphotransferase [Paracoccaceae bacterium]
MTDRATNIQMFLNSASWGDAVRKPLAGDASRRRYERLKNTDGQDAILMDADPATGEDVVPFIKIANHLNECGLNAPEIFAADPQNGMLLLQDFGNGLFAKLMANDPNCQRELYTRAVDVLLALHKCPMPDPIPAYPPLMPDLAALAVVWYRGGLLGDDPALEGSLYSLMKDAIAGLPTHDDVLILRDYHSENLLWLPDQTGLAKVGLLDFQDAMSGHAAYDLVSLTKDARRDVPKDIARELQDYYSAKSGVNAAEFAQICATVSAQRNLRILGVFARLCIRDGAAHYLDFIPRVWDHLIDDLAHPSLDVLATFVKDNLPAPTPENLQILRDKCKK